MEVTFELVYLGTIVVLTILLLMWFILTFVPSMLGLKKRDRGD